MPTPEALKKLAQRKGCNLVKASRGGCWRIIAPTGEAMKKLNGSSAFAPGEVHRILRQLPEPIYEPTAAGRAGGR